MKIKQENAAKPSWFDLRKSGEKTNKVLESDFMQENSTKTCLIYLESLHKNK